MRWIPGVGQVNAVLVALYFIPTWGRDAVRALTSSVYGLDDPNTLAAAMFYRRVLDLGAEGLPRAASVLAGMKLVVTSMFVAYSIDVMRGIVTGREGDRATLDAALFFAAAGIVIAAIPAYLAGSGITRLYATQFLLIAGAVAVTTFERFSERPAAAPTRSVIWRRLRERDGANGDLPPGWLRTLGMGRGSNDN